MSKSKVTATSSKNRKLTRKLNEDKRLMKSMDAFSPESMYDDDLSVARDSGIIDTYNSTTNFDNEW